MGQTKSSQPLSHHSFQSWPTPSRSEGQLRNTAADICTPGLIFRASSATRRTTTLMFERRKSSHFSRTSPGARVSFGHVVTARPSAASKRARQPSQKQASFPG